MTREEHDRLTAVFHRHVCQTSEQPLGIVVAGLMFVLAVVLLRGLSGPTTRTWLDER